MTDIQHLPVLSLTDVVVLPGMVVPIELDESAQAAVDAARSTATGPSRPAHADTDNDSADKGGADKGIADSVGQLLLAPRLKDRYATYGVVATIEQVGQLAGGAPAAVLRAGRRAKIGTGVTGPGAALWVAAEVVADEAPTEQARTLAKEYKSLVIATLQQRDAWQVINTVEKMTDPATIADSAGWAPYITAEQKRELLETPDVITRLELVIDWTRAHLAEMDVADKIRGDVREGMEKSQREFLLRQQLAAIRKELGEGEPDGADDFRTRVETADLPEKVRKRLCVRSVAWSGPASRARSRAGSAPGWTPCWSCRGRSRRRTTPTSPTHGPSSTPTTTGWTT